MISNLKDQVIEILRDIPETRNSDITLTIEIWKRFFPEKTIGGECSAVRFSDLYDLPREDNIKRIRAKLTEEELKRINEGKMTGEEYVALPTSEQVAKKRCINEALWQKALGYFKRPVPVQTEQLPRPVGMNGFTMIDPLHFTVQGSGGKEYHVSTTPEGWWSCECEAFRYASRGEVRTCKHIDTIVEWQKAKAKEEAAKKQKPLFN